MQAMGQDMPTTKATLEINPRHAVIHGLSNLMESDKETAGLVVQQLADNALLSAGLLDNPHKMTARMNELIGKLVQSRLSSNLSL